MSIDSSAKSLRIQRPRTLKAHLLGLLGANLVIGTLALWAMPLIVERLRHPDHEWSALRLLASWSPRGEIGVVAILLDLAGLAIILFGILLMLRASIAIQERPLD